MISVWTYTVQFDTYPLVDRPGWVSVNARHRCRTFQPEPIDLQWAVPFDCRQEDLAATVAQHMRDDAGALELGAEIAKAQAATAH